MKKDYLLSLYLKNHILGFLYNLDSERGNPQETLSLEKVSDIIKELGEDN